MGTLSLCRDQIQINGMHGMLGNMNEVIFNDSDWSKVIPGYIKCVAPTELY